MGTMSSDNSQNGASNKRRRTSEATPPPVPSSDTENETTNVLESIRLEQIPRLLLVDVQKQDPKHVERSLKELNELINRNNAAETVFRVGGHGILFVVLSKWQNHESIQCSGIRCLGNLAQKAASVPTMENCLGFIGSNGGVELIVAAMTNFPRSLDIQVVTIGSLINIFSKPGLLMSKANEFVRELGGLELLSFAMTQFLRSLELQKRSVGLLINLLAFNGADSPKLFLKHGLVVLVATAMTEFLNDDWIQTRGKTFMNKMFGGTGGK